MSHRSFSGLRASWATIFFLVSLCVVLLLGIASRPAHAEGSTTKATDKAEPAKQAPPSAANELRDQVARRRLELSERIERLTQQSQLAQPGTEDVLLADLEHLKQIDLLLLQHEAALEFLAEQYEELATWNKDLESLRANGIDEPQPYTVSLLDETEDQVETETVRRQAAVSELATARMLLEAAQEEHEECQRERRRIQDEPVPDDDPANERNAALARKEAELACSLAAERVSLRRVELDVRTAREEVCAARYAYYDEKAKRIDGHVVFTDAELTHRLGKLNDYMNDLRKQAQAIERRLERWPMEEAAARQQLTETSAARDIWDEAEQTWQTTRRTLHERLAMKNQRLAEFRRFQDLLRWRFDAAQGRAEGPDELKDWRDTIEEFQEHVQQTEQGLSRRVEELRLDLSNWQRRLVTIDTSDEPLRPWIEARILESQALSDDCENSILLCKTGLRGSQRCLVEIKRRLPDEDSQPLSERLAEWWSSVWDYELAAVDDRPITVGKVIGALLYLFVGVFVARIISRLAGRRLLPRVGMDRGASLAVQSITFYLLCAVGGFLALEFAHLPLTAFTFMGGAAAIGIGFGSQNILNNFISGLILLAEQPIRVGDVVELNNTYGTVEHIGMRSTRVRTGANFELIVPNSKLLENNVVNLTLTDNSIRGKVSVSFAYGSPIQDVKQLLLNAAAENPRILTTPAPSVLVSNFGANAIEFELSFSMNIQSFGECRGVESEVREAIDAAYYRWAGVITRPPLDATASAPAFDLHRATNNSRRAA